MRNAAPLRQLRGASAALHVFISHPDLADDLCAFLKRAECVVEHIQGHDFEVGIPHSPSAAQARRELDIYLATWQAMNPGVEAYVVYRDHPASRRLKGTPKQFRDA